MNEWETLAELCRELLSDSTHEAVIAELFYREQAEWISVRELGELCEIDQKIWGDEVAELYVVWLPHPTGDPDYALGSILRLCHEVDNGCRLQQHPTISQIGTMTKDRENAVHSFR